MKLNKLQRQARAKAVQQAAVTAIKQYFTGEHARSHAIQFVRDALLRSGSWAVGLGMLMSWAVVGGLLIGPDHNAFLAQLHAWMVATPVDKVIAMAHDVAYDLGTEILQISLLAGFVHKLINVATPAADDAREQFHASLV